MSELRELIEHRPLEGRLIRLRPREMEDEPAMHSWINDPDVTQNLAARYPYSHEAEREFVKSVTKIDYSNAGFGIETLAEGKFIGSLGFHKTEAESRSATLGIMIGEKDYWNRGYGTDAMRVLCRFGFEQMNLHRIELEVLAVNSRARRVYEKVGFQHEGTRRDAFYKFGRYIDAHVMSLLEGELRWD
jgi:RimJ/RimL family protein N-acetyltransferase